MEKKTETELEEIIHYYGSLEAYNEEQRRCALGAIETTLQANPGTQQFRVEHALPLEIAEARPVQGRFRLKFFGQEI